MRSGDGRASYNDCKLPQKVVFSENLIKKKIDIVKANLSVSRILFYVVQLLLSVGYESKNIDCSFYPRIRAYSRLKT